MISITIIYIIIMAAGAAMAGKKFGKYKNRNKELYNCNTNLKMKNTRLENELKKLTENRNEGRVTGLYCHKCEHGIQANPLTQIQCELNINCIDYKRRTEA